MRALVFTAALVAAAPVAAQDARPDGHLELAVGARQVLPDEGLASYSESGPGFFDVELDAAGHLVVIGRRVGTKTILLVFSDGTQRRYTITVI